MERLNIDDVYGYDSVKVGDWVWCSNCKRAYRKGMYREFSKCWRELDLRYFKGSNYSNESEFADLCLPEKLCPYSDCDAGVELAFGWKFVQEGHKEYPEIPELDKKYKL
jgi:hypothetical protein